jgi:hypothetical protein
MAKTPAAPKSTRVKARADPEAAPFVPDEAPAAPPPDNKPRVTSVEPLFTASLRFTLSTGDTIDVVCAGNGGVASNATAREQLLAALRNR